MTGAVLGRFGRIGPSMAVTKGRHGVTVGARSAPSPWLSRLGKQSFVHIFADPHGAMSRRSENCRSGRHVAILRYPMPGPCVRLAEDLMTSSVILDHKWR